MVERGGEVGKNEESRLRYAQGQISYDKYDQHMYLKCTNIFNNKNKYNQVLKRLFSHMSDPMSFLAFF